MMACLSIIHGKCMENKQQQQQQQQQQQNNKEKIYLNGKEMKEMWRLTIIWASTNQAYNVGMAANWGHNVKLVIQVR